MSSANVADQREGRQDRTGLKTIPKCFAKYY